MELIKHFESCRLEAYKDSAGIATIGWGSTKGVKMGMKITQEKADELLKEDLKQAEERVRKALPNMEFTKHELDALISLAYNLRSFEQLANHLKKDKELFKKKLLQYCHDVKGNLLGGLKRRRISERLLFEGKDWMSVSNELEGKSVNEMKKKEQELFT